MTPLHLDILFHYWTRGDDYELIKTNPTRREYAYDLAQAGYLFTPYKAERMFEVTACGKKKIENIMECFSKPL